MRVYVSFGAGVNSVAMVIYMIRTSQQIDAIVFCDTGAEHPETYEYLGYFEKQYLWKHGLKITLISAQGMGLEKGDLLDHLKQYSIIPMRINRFCTDRYKVKPLLKFYLKPCYQALGIDAGEAHRAKLSRNKEVISVFPLIEAGIDRRKCIEIIQSENLCVPRKSGCFFCAFAPVRQFKQLYEQHPVLFQEVVKLEEEHHKKYNLKKGGDYFIKDKPMWELATQFQQEIETDNLQLDLFEDPQDSMNCLCKFA